MNYIDKQAIFMLMFVVSLSLVAGISFGLWHNSWSAGVFMTTFALIMQGNKK